MNLPIPTPLSLAQPVVKIAATVAVVGVGAYFAKKAYDKWIKNSAEKELDTPAGLVAMQLKNVFDEFPVSDTKYQAAASQITPAIKDDVYRIYRGLTGGRNLSDDIAKHIGATASAVAERQAKINNTPGTILRIDNDQIKFEVGKGSLVRFTPGSTTAIPLFMKPEGVLPEGILNDKIAPTYVLQPKAYNFLVNDVKVISLDGLKLNNSWTILWKPWVHTKKTFAVVQITLPMTNPNGKKSTISLWADARSFIKGKGTAYLKGLGCGCEIRKSLKGIEIAA